MADRDAVCGVRSREYLDNAVRGVHATGGGGFLGGALQEHTVLAVGGRASHDHDKIQKEILEKIEVFKKATESGLFGFSVGTFEDTLKAYEKAGYPPLSHSDTYRAHYRPAYRVVSKKHITWQG